MGIKLSETLKTGMLTTRLFAGSESFVRRSPTLPTFFRGERIHLLVKPDHYQPASEMPFQLRFTGCPLMDQN